MDNSGYIYVFVRQDLPIPVQLVQTVHAVERMAKAHQYGGHPAAVVIGCPHPKAMARVLDKLAYHSIPHVAYTDPEHQELGMTAIATTPLSDGMRSWLANYRLYSFGTEQSACGLSADEGASSPTMCQEGQS